jgi:phosphoglycerate dehydrogenase-like enzyme
MSGERIAVLLPDGGARAALAALDGVADPVIADSRESLVRALSGTEILLVWVGGHGPLQDAWPHAGSLRWLHTASLGVDGVLFDDVVASDVVVTNTRGVFEAPIAEYVIGLLLLWTKDLARTLVFQRRREWHYRATAMLAGRRVTIIGAGGIAVALSQRLRALGVRLDVVGRTTRLDPVLGQISSLEDADEVLTAAEFVVLALPLTVETRGLIDERQLSRLSPGVRVVNVGRGAVVDEDALLAALRSGRIAGAALDVFQREPLPPEHPFWTTEGVIISPHMSGDVTGWQDTVVRGFIDNLGRWWAGAPLVNVVDKERFRVTGSGGR